MNIEDSFEYVFRNLLKEIRLITVSYGHNWEQFEQNPSSFDRISWYHPYNNKHACWNYSLCGSS